MITNLRQMRYTSKRLKVNKLLPKFERPFAINQDMNGFGQLDRCCGSIELQKVAESLDVKLSDLN